MKPVRNKMGRRTAVPQPPPAKASESIVLGQCLEGGLMSEANLALWPLRDVNKHAVILGQPDAGKTTTAKKIAYEVLAKDPTAQVFILDLGADPSLARAFGSIAKKLDKDVRFYPQERFDVWTGDWRSTFFRLMEIIPFAAEDTPAAHYTAKATVILELACRMDGRPPRSIVELLDRLEMAKLKKKFGVKAMRGIQEKEVIDVYTRCRELAAHFGTSLDGGWSFGDVDGAYFGLDSMVLGKGVAVTLRMLLAHLQYYIKHEKEEGRRCVVIIDEFAALSRKAEVSVFVEQARKLGVGVILMAQTVAGMGDQSQIQRTLRSSGRLILHSTADWALLRDEIGIELMPDMTLAFGDGEDAELNRMQIREEYKVTQRDLLSLGKGQVWVLWKNDAALVEIEAPDDAGDDRFQLPEQEELLFPVEQKEEIRTEISAPGYLEGEEPTESFQNRKFQIPAEFTGSDLHPEPADSDGDTDAEADSTDE